jgi:16S rRNA (guanine966-N2)-methyltransferase
MRIIAGTKKGMNLLSPKSEVSRPILDRVKESLFSVLYRYDMPVGKTVADIFCGVGSLGLEALSRGATAVTFVEKDPRVVQVLRKNIDRAGFADRAHVISAGAFRLAQTGFGDQAFDLIFVDPPYALSEDTSQGSKLGKLLTALADNLSQAGLIIVRTHKKTTLQQSYGGLNMIDRREWAKMTVTFLARSADDSEAGGS